jgi:hypothetical protein
MAGRGTTDLLLHSDDFRVPFAPHALGPSPESRVASPESRRKAESRPVSRVLSRTVIPLGPASPQGSSDQPGRGAGHAMAPLFGLAPGGVYRAAACCHPRGALLPHLFTLTCARRPSAVCFLWHFPSARAAQGLPGTLPCGARTFLPAPKARSDCPAGFPPHSVRARRRSLKESTLNAPLRLAPPQCSLDH